MIEKTSITFNPDVDTMSLYIKYSEMELENKEFVNINVKHISTVMKIYSGMYKYVDGVKVIDPDDNVYLYTNNYSPGTEIKQILPKSITIALVDKMVFTVTLVLIGIGDNGKIYTSKEAMELVDINENIKYFKPVNTTTPNQYIDLVKTINSKIDPNNYKFYINRVNHKFYDAVTGSRIASIIFTASKTRPGSGHYPNYGYIFSGKQEDSRIANYSKNDLRVTVTYNAGYMKPNPDGTYENVFTSSLESDGIILKASVPSLDTSSLASSSTSLVCNGTSSITFTLTLLNGGGNPMTGKAVVFNTDAGSLTPTTELGNGQYRTTLTSKTVNSTSISGTTNVKSVSVDGVPFVISKPIKLTRYYVKAASGNGLNITESQVASSLNANESIYYESSNGAWIETVYIPAASFINKGCSVKVTTQSTWGTIIRVNGVATSYTNVTKTYYSNGSTWTT